MGLKIASALLVTAGLLLMPEPTSAQDLGPHFKKVKDGIITYVAKPDESNCTIILTNEGVVLIDSGHNATDSQTILKTVKQLTPLPIRFLINTEPHADHAAARPRARLGEAGAHARADSERAEDAANRNLGWQGALQHQRRDPALGIGRASLAAPKRVARHGEFRLDATRPLTTVAGTGGAPRKSN